jgi:choline-glycine betaine transporter
MVAGMASSLATGVLTLTGGLQLTPGLDGLSPTPLVLGIVTLVVVVSFVLSSASGLQRGIAKLADLNIYFFIGVLVFLLIFRPTIFLLSFGLAFMT